MACAFSGDSVMRANWFAAAAVTAGGFLVTGTAIAATSYLYDDLGRLCAVCYDNGNEIAYKYDAAGNRTSVVIQAGTCTACP